MKVMLLKCRDTSMAFALIRRKDKELADAHTNLIGKLEEGITGNVAHDIVSFVRILSLHLSIQRIHLPAIIMVNITSAFDKPQ